MKFYIPVFLLLVLFSCSSETEPGEADNDNNLSTENGDPVCPENHTDSIIPIVYGMPSEELFDQADSGLVYLHGCEIPEDPKDWWCKIHEIKF